MNLAGTSVNSLGASSAARAKAAYGFDPFEMVRVFGARVFAIAKHITQNDDDAGDVLIDAFLEVCPDPDGCPDNEQAWLRLVNAVEHIASIVNRSVAAVEVCLLRARLRLGEMLGQQAMH